MTINISGSQVQIKNSAGQVKFTSDNKLIYFKSFQQGTVTIPAYTSYVDVYFPAPSDNDIIILTVQIDSSNGYTGIISPLLGLELPTSGGIVVDFNGRAIGAQPGADTEYISVNPYGNNLRFKSTAFTYLLQQTNGAGSHSLTYRARTWSYL